MMTTKQLIERCILLDRLYLAADAATWEWIRFRGRKAKAAKLRRLELARWRKHRKFVEEDRP